MDETFEKQSGAQFHIVVTGLDSLFLVFSHTICKISVSLSCPLPVGMTMLASQDCLED